MKVSPYYIDVGKNNSNLVGGGGGTHIRTITKMECAKIFCASCM